MEVILNCERRNIAEPNLFSYRHGFHAGNHADVLKHVVLVQMLAYLTAKETPLWFVDTHAGAGIYSLDSAFARKNGEFKDGIGRLWERQRSAARAGGVPRSRSRRSIRTASLRHYPGSPQIALQMLREQDRLQLFELHSTESEVLQKQYREREAQVSVQPTDGFAGLKAVLPPASRRGLVLIDPSYEDKADYRKVVDSDAGCACSASPPASTPSGTRRCSARNRRNCRASCSSWPQGDWLHVSLKVMTPARGWAGSARQRHVRLQSALETRGGPAAGDAGAGQAARPGQEGVLRLQFEQALMLCGTITRR